MRKILNFNAQARRGKAVYACLFFHSLLSLSLSPLSLSLSNSDVRTSLVVVFVLLL